MCLGWMADGQYVTCLLSSSTLAVFPSCSDFFIDWETFTAECSGRDSEGSVISVLPHSAWSQKRALQL